ncbi:MAG TPA: GreA/GreB family elongation factor [Candidatus Limnocylindrales bacterium]|jgi:transcription elongation factor GreA
MISNVAQRPKWPMTAEAHAQLLDELAKLRRDVATPGGQGLEDGVVRLPIVHAARRLEVLGTVVDAATITDETCVAIGRDVEVLDGDGHPMRFSIVFPGAGDPAQGWISADSPLGAALLGALPGARVMVDAPAGPWSVTVTDVR